jgi:soluble lytic murein transglycosylase-like protein
MMVWAVLVASLLVIGGLPAWADMLQYRGAEGRLYFTNIPPASSTALGTPPRPFVLPLTAHAAYHSTLGLVHTLARQYDIEPRLIQAIITVESNFNPQAVSRAGAQGLMQLMPDTAARYQVRDPFNPQANIEGGIRYLKDLLHLFPGDLQRVLAAYNAGEQAVYQYGGMPPYPETRRYVERVLSLYGAHDTTRKIYRYQTTNGSILFTDTPR